MSPKNHIHGTPILIAAAADGALPSQIEVMPVGKLTFYDGRAINASVTDPDDLIDRSLEFAAGNILPIDFDHGLDQGGTGDGRAAGWITAMSVVDDRIMAEVEWTDEGEKALKSKTYRFISPTFTLSKKGDVTLILRAGLTNNPAFHDLKQVASKKKEPGMDPFLKKLAEALGLGDETDETKIQEAAVTAAAQSVLMEPLFEAAGHEGEVSQTVITAMSAKLKADASEDDPDPSKFVPMDVFQAVKDEVATLSKKVTSSQTSSLVTAAMNDGKVTPAMEDWANKYAAKDPEGFKAWLETQPVIAAKGALIPALKPTETGALTDDEKKIIAGMGVSEEAYLATKQGKPLPAQKKKEA